MKLKNKKRLENILLGPEESPFSFRKQMSRAIRLYCTLVAVILIVVLVTMFMVPYARQEQEDSLYMLKSSHVKMNDNFQYLEEMALSIRSQTGLNEFFKEDIYDRRESEEELKAAVNLFGERNRMEFMEPFVEKIYLFNTKGEAIYHLYYPETITKIQKEQECYEKIYWDFSKNGKTDFYYTADKENVNLCMSLYDDRMNLLGTCIFALNRSGIENNYENLEKYQYYRWEIRQGEKVILGKEAVPENGWKKELGHSIDIGFDLTLYSAIPAWLIWKDMGAVTGLIVFMTFALSLILAYCGHRLSEHYVESLEVVAEKIGQVGKGKFDTKLSKYRVAELQNISDTFNEMTNYIDRLVTEVYETQLIAKQAQIQYLQAQMNPHFLFNVLSMIEMRAAINQDREVQEMIYKLSKLYQGKIFRKNEYFIFLKEEMEIIDFYLSLQSRRFGEKITYTIDYEGALADYDKLMVPRLSVEPIVENAVCYGLEPKAEKGCIHIRVEVQEEILKIYIEDDGVGFHAELLTEQKEDKNHTHVGLWNTNKMIRNLCGKEYGLQIKSEIGVGTTVCVLLPVRIGEENVESNGC